jgi:eukaryotic-like serine/threonine-protein kinase
MAECGSCHAKHWLSSDLPPMEPVPCSKCGHPVIVPTLLRNFEIREVVASGGMGTVYRAFDVSLERTVAIKMLKREVADDKQVMESFYREARATASLNHTNIIHVYSFDEHNGSPYIVMELADHGSLDSIIIRDGFVRELTVLDVGIKVADALESALQHNLLHRDIKPGNILFNEYGEPKLVDFGLARQAAEGAEYESTIWGTPYYVAPEKIQRQGEDFHSDMYSLGGTLYHALTGHVPFEAETVEQVVAGHVHTPLTPPNDVRTEISQATSDAIATAMAKDPAQRFTTYFDFKMALEAARAQFLLQNQSSAAPDEEEGKGRSRSWWRR